MEKLQFWCSHLSMAHLIWKGLLNSGDWVVDATCGNGKDCFYLAQLVGPSGGVIALDIQPQAIQQAQRTCYAVPWVYFFCQSHETFPLLIKKNRIQLIVYNLGYLPGGDHTFTTVTETTVKSVKNALQILAPYGIISITCYPGHKEGAQERDTLLRVIQSWSKQEVSVSHTQWKGEGAPELFIIQKKACNKSVIK